MRLIDADALIEKYQQESGVDLYRYNVIQDLVESPTVDAVPVRHGKWTKHEEMSPEWNTSETWYKCNRCGFDTLWRTPYCPMCGRKMGDADD